MNIVPTLEKKSLVITVSAVLLFVALVLVLSGGKSFLAQQVSGLVESAPQPPKKSEVLKPAVAPISPVKYSPARNVIVIGKKLDDAPPLRKAEH